MGVPVQDWGGGLLQASVSQAPHKVLGCHPSNVSFNLNVKADQIPLGCP